MDAINYAGLRLFNNEIYIDEPPFSETNIQVEHDGSLPNMFKVDFEELNVTCVSNFKYSRNQQAEGEAEIKMNGVGATFDLNYGTRQDFVTKDYGFHIGISAFRLTWSEDNIEIDLRGGTSE